MRAWIVPEGCTAGPDGLRLVERPSPEPGRGEVLVRMRAWSLNARDLAVAAGRTSAARSRAARWRCRTAPARSPP